MIPQATLDELVQLRNRVADLEAELAMVKVRDDDVVIDALRKRYGLTKTEARFLNFLADGRPHTKHACLVAAGSGKTDETKIMDVYACKVRRKIGMWAIETIWGEGYRIGAEFKDQLNKIRAEALALKTQ
jgi:DNA-binding response OmpR family regulator